MRCNVGTVAVFLSLMLQRLCVVALAHCDSLEPIQSFIKYYILTAVSSLCECEME